MYCFSLSGCRHIAAVCRMLSVERGAWYRWAHLAASCCGLKQSCAQLHWVPVCLCQAGKSSVDFAACCTYVQLRTPVAVSGGPSCLCCHTMVITGHGHACGVIHGLWLPGVARQRLHLVHVCQAAISCVLMFCAWQSISVGSGAVNSSSCRTLLHTKISH